MNMPLNVAASPLRKQAANTLLRARKLPPGPYRNDLRQLGMGLLKLYKGASELTFEQSRGEWSVTSNAPHLIGEDEIIGRRGRSELADLPLVIQQTRAIVEASRSRLERSHRLLQQRSYSEELRK